MGGGPFPTIVGQPTVQMIPVMQPMMGIRMPTLGMPTMQQMQPNRVSQAYYQFDGPPVTVFVGNIAEDVTDTLVRQILMKVGPVNNWKRVQGTNGKLQGFGFCEYKEPDAALRSLRLLQGLAVYGKQLLIKVDDQAQNVIENWKMTVGLKKDSDGIDVLSPQIRARDESVRVDIKALLKEYQADIQPIEQKVEKKNEEPKKEEKKKDHKKEKNDDPDKDKPDKEKSASKSKDEVEVKKDSKRTGSRDRSSTRDASKRKSRSRSHSRTHRRRSRSKERSRSRRSRTKDRSRERERRRRSEERRREEDEMLERKKLERKMKEKNSAYQERLNVWEARERRKAREWERLELKDADKRRQMNKEARRLRDFLEGYDDEKDDRKFYFGSGSAFMKRIESRKRELEDDLKDRKKEEGEIAGLHGKLGAEGHPDPDGAIAKVIKEAEEVWKPFIKPDIRKKKKRDSSTSRSEPEDSSESDESGRESDDEPLDAQVLKQAEDEPAESNKPTRHTSDEDDDDGVEMDLGDGPPPEAPPISLPALAIAKTVHEQSPSTRPARKVPAIFNEEEPSEDPSLPGARKRKRETPKPKEILDQDERRRAVKALIERIPTDRGPLFAYPMKWDYLGSDLMEKRISPWVKKKLNEIIGEDEPTLILFITDKLSGEAKPEQILSEIRVVLDEEAEVFVIKLWRLLIYETEARAEGISG